MDGLWEQQLRAPEPSRASSEDLRKVDPMEFLSRSWSVSALEVSNALAHHHAAGAEPAHAAPPPPTILEGFAAEAPEDHQLLPSVAGNSFTFATSATSQLVLDRIMSQSEVSPLASSGRLSHSSGPLAGCATAGGQSSGSISDSSPVSPSEMDDLKYCGSRTNGGGGPPNRAAGGGGGGRTVGRWLKDRRERKKEEARAHNAKLHAAVSVAGVAAAVAAIAAATVASSAGRDNRAARVDMAVASAVTLVAAQCVEAAEAMGADRDHLAAVVGSAVSVRNPGDIVTLTAAAATALRGAATLKARTLKEVWNIAAVIPVEKGGGGGGGVGTPSHHNHDPSKEDDGGDEGRSRELVPLPPPAGEEDENFLGLCSQELLARGSELLKRTRAGVLHWKIVSVYIHRTGVVMLKMKSRHVAGTITKKKKSVVVDVCKDIPAWPGRNLMEGGERRRYFGLTTGEGRTIEFECRNQREFEIWTQGVARLLGIVRDRKRSA